MLSVNMLISWRAEADEQSRSTIERILWIDSSASDCITIEVTGERVLPKLRRCRELLSALSSSDAQVLDSDPYAANSPPEDLIPEDHRKHRDKAYALIEPLVAEGAHEIMICAPKRGRLVTEIAKREGRAKSTVYNYLRWFWQAGSVRNALLPDYDKCGGPGKQRVAANLESPKRGRPKLYKGTPEDAEGINITPAVERKFERGVKRFFETLDRNSLHVAFEKTLEEFFYADIKLVNKVPTKILPPADKLPTERQFRYWYDKHRDVIREKKAREGERGYNLKTRELLSDSTQMAFGPGSLYQIDSTIGDIYLVNSLDRSRIVGRPVIYACIDVFSRMNTGICATLEGPSWLGAMLALDNVVADKVAFCADYGVEIEQSQWPSSHLPEAILADRGELEGYDADRLVNSLTVNVQNTGPWRPDWKGIIERHFGIVRERSIRFVPGAVHRMQARGSPDYRLDAVLTLGEFRKLLIYHALSYNMDHYIENYKKDEFMIADHVERYPIDFWNWGINNRSGHLRMMARDIVRLNLLPRKQASVTARGIHFEGDLYYTCAMGLEQGWFSRARDRGTWKVEVAYDPRSTDTVYLLVDGGRTLVPCRLTEASKNLSGRDLHEAMDYYALERQAEATALTRKYNASAALNATRKDIVAEATEKTLAAHAATGRRSKAARTKDIRDNRLQEREHERTQDAWRLGTGGDAAEPTEAEQSLQTPEQTYIAPSSYAEELRRLRDEEWNGSQS